MSQYFQPASRPIARGPIWSETLEKLAARWLKLREDAGEPIVGVEARVVVDRIRRRAATIREALNLPEGRLLTTARQWEVGWKPREVQSVLNKSMKEFGCVVSVANDSQPEGHSFSPSAPRAARIIVIELEAAQSLARRLREAGLLLPVGEEEGLILLQCRELFDAAAESLGHRPAESWVDELAPHLLAQQILGWPFCPWIADLVPSGEPTL